MPDYLLRKHHSGPCKARQASCHNYHTSHRSYSPHRNETLGTLNRPEPFPGCTRPVRLWYRTKLRLSVCEETIVLPKVPKVVQEKVIANLLLVIRSSRDQMERHVAVVLLSAMPVRLLEGATIELQVAIREEREPALKELLMRVLFCGALMHPDTLESAAGTIAGCLTDRDWRVRCLAEHLLESVPESLLGLAEAELVLRLQGSRGQKLKTLARVVDSRPGCYRFAARVLQCQQETFDQTV